jgi:RNA polymerase sigma-70 factor, ECF subfamily
MACRPAAPPSIPPLSSSGNRRAGSGPGHRAREARGRAGFHLPRRGDRRETAEAVAQIFDDHVWDVYGFIAYRCSQRSDAEDLTQQTFERALKAWRSFDPERAAVKTWLLAIAHNLVIDHFRRDRSRLHRPIGEDGIAEEDLPASEDPEMAGVSPEVAAALATLTARDQEIVALRFGGDLTGPEIAQMLDLSLSNVQQILSRSLRRMRDELEPAAPAKRRAAPKRKPRAKRR